MVKRKLIFSAFFMFAFLFAAFGTPANATAATTGSLVVSNQTSFNGITVAIQTVNIDGGADYSIFANGVLQHNWTAGSNEDQRSFYFQPDGNVVYELATGGSMTNATTYALATILDSYTVNGVDFGVFIPQDALIDLAVTFMVLFLIVSILLTLVAGGIYYTKRKAMGD